MIDINQKKFRQVKDNLKGKDDKYHRSKLRTNG